MAKVKKPVELITRERVERAMARTDHARLSEGDVKTLRKLLADIESSQVRLDEYHDAVESRLRHRPTPPVEATSRPERKSIEEELAGQLESPQSFKSPHPYHSGAGKDGCTLP